MCTCNYNIYMQVHLGHFVYLQVFQKSYAYLQVLKTSYAYLTVIFKKNYSNFKLRTQLKNCKIHLLIHKLMNIDFLSNYWMDLYTTLGDSSPTFFKFVQLCSTLFNIVQFCKSLCIFVNFVQICPMLLNFSQHC